MSPDTDLGFWVKMFLFIVFGLIGLHHSWSASKLKPGSKALRVSRAELAILAISVLIIVTKSGMQITGYSAPDGFYYLLTAAVGDVIGFVGFTALETQMKNK